MRMYNERVTRHKRSTTNFTGDVRALSVRNLEEWLSGNPQGLEGKTHTEETSRPNPEVPYKSNFIRQYLYDMVHSLYLRITRK